MVRRSFVVACALLVACGRGRTNSSTLVLQDDWGRRVTLAGPAHRIVSLAPATTELVFALGLGDRLVGRTTWCDWPAEAKAVPDIGNGIGPNVEAIAQRHPDLVLIYPSEANRAAVQQLEGVGIPVAALKQDAIAEWRETVRWVARAAGVASRADTLLSDFDRRLADARKLAGEAAPSAFVAVGANPPMAIGGGSFISELLALAGGRNAFADLKSPSAVVSLEAIVARQPDVVIVLGPDSALAGVVSRPGWRAIPAIQAGHVLAIDGSEFNRPSPRLPDAVRTLATRLAPYTALR